MKIAPILSVMHALYADDTALLSQSLIFLQLLINSREEFANHNHITFNIDKSVILPIYFDKSYHNPVKLTYKCC